MSERFPNEPHEEFTAGPETPAVKPDEFERDPRVDEVFEQPEVVSYTTLRYDMPERDGRELPPGHRLLFVVPEEYRGRLVRDVVLRHRKAEQFRVDIGARRYDPHGAYSYVELHDTEAGWVGWRDPKGYDPVKYAEHRPSGDPENEVLHDWLATVGAVEIDAARVTSVGDHKELSIVNIHGVEIVFFPELEGIAFEERIYTPGTSFIDLGKKQYLPTYGGGSRTEGRYPGALQLNGSGHARFELGDDPGQQAELRDGELIIELTPGQQLVQVEVSIGDTEHLAMISPKTGKKTRLGWAKMSVGIQRKTERDTLWFIKRANVPPQGVLAGGPHLADGVVQPGDKLIIRSEDDTSYVMGWRLAYKQPEEKTGI